MARYRIVHWKEIPSLVEAADGDRAAREQLSQKFQDLIDALAMRENATDEDAYLDGWGQGEWLERPGSPDEVARAVAAEIEDGFQALLVKRFLPKPC
jgi:alkanesulfonate monooxygenase SsuD/methylene tetrahydromethanopterin reductase-like flavin-dependent oxidoreductase (luciferase family)